MRQPRRSRAPRPRFSLARAALEALESRRLLATSTIVFPGSDGRLIYAPDVQGDVIPDFSQVGYKTGSVPLPNTTGGVSVPVKITLNPGATGVDRTTDIQTAINTVSGMSPDANGFKGAVLLTAGNYPISGTLNINSSGVVLMGVGDSSTTGTRLEATGTATRFLIEVDGSGSRSTSGATTYTISDTYVPVGARSFHVSSTSGLAVGNDILVNRPSPANWIHDIGMDLLDNPWQPGTKDQNWERKITAISGNLITIDVPLTNSLDAQYGGGTFKKYTWSGGSRLSQVGISDVYMYSDSTGAGDLAHATGSIDMDRTVDGWIHNITSDGFAVNQVILSSNAKYCTLDDAVIQNTTVSSQAPPAGVSVNGPLNLVENVVEHGVYHAVALGAQVPGPNVITNLFADGIGSDCGPHQRWSTGGLFDDVTIVGNDLQAFNRGNSGTGHGWAGANYVFWNCSARNLEIDNPPTAQNWAIGCIGNQSSPGTFDSLGTNVQPFSLYQKQLWDRLHQNPTVVTPASATPNPRTSSTTNLSVLGGYNLGESNLTYTWATTSKPAGAANPTFSVNGTNAAKNSVATFATAGTYVLSVTISDAGGLLATSSVIVTDRPTTQVNGTGNPNIIRIVRNGSFTDATVDGALALHQDYASSPEIVIAALGGDDSITVDYSGGDPVPANGLFIDAGSGSDAIVAAGSSGNDAVTLSAGNVTVNGGTFQFTGGEELDLNVGVGSDTLASAGNASVNVPKFVLVDSGVGTLAITPGSTLPDFTDLTVNGGATLDLGNTSQTIDSLSGNGAIQTSASAAVNLTVGQQGGDGVYTGSIKNGSGTLSLVKNGPGTLTLAGTNSYTGTSTINAGVIEAGAPASFVGLSGQVRFGGGTLHVTADGAAANIANKFTTSYSGATSADTATFDIDAGVTLTIGGNAASMQTNGGGSHGGTFTKTGLGTLRILSNNGQLDDPFKLNAGTVIVQSATGLGGADNSANHVDMKAGTTLILRQDASTNFLTPIDPQDAGGTVNVVIDRLTAGAAPTHSVNAITSVGSFTINLTAGANVTSGAATLAVGSITFGGGGSFAQSGNATLALANNLTGVSALSITGGTFRLTPLATRVIVTPTLAITGGGKLDLSDNKLIVTTPNQLGSFNGSIYTGISGLVRSGRNGGTWNGSGIVTSMPAALSGNMTTLAAARLGDVRGNLPDSQTVVFAGQTVPAGSTIVMYTYAGDSDFNGKITIDDYGRIDFNVGLGSSGWFNGDFNYDGKINVDDYGVIDFNIAAQGPPFPT